MFIFPLMFRFLRTLPFMLILSLNTSSALAASAPPSIAVFDWTTAEALIALNPPGSVLMGNITVFHTWTGNEYAHADVTDIGTPSFPNLELLSSINPSRMLLAPRHTRMKAVLDNIVTSNVIQSYPYTNNSSDDLWSRFDAFVLEMGELSGRRAAAEKLIINTQSKLESLKNKLEPQPPLLVVQLITEQYVRVYGDNSIFQGVLLRLGLRNAWTGETDRWGRSLVSIRELFNIHLEDARLVVMESAFPAGIENNIETSGMWRYLPSVQRGDYVVLPSTFWIAGVHPSALRFAEALVEALETPAEP
ncbi:ABC transporter substrate-binding protein [Halovibrio variabilis]|uniref:ABC transporter substrate-binding protein n=1 Tax=Halovibrio variabilis TaxID=31910 RepID=A0A511URA0_9GAMM|nr:ABC transporter substrate-binding protein [Halovibrio variabilis]GEN29119.1 ABC transporter substrate-binding protein [Halovibrio variabilis]